MSRSLPFAVALACLAGACAAPTDDGELLVHAPVAVETSGAPATDQAATTPDRPSEVAARPVVVDTDLGADDLLALAAILSRRDLSVVAITVAGNGLVHCAAGVTIAAQLVEVAGIGPIPIGCGATQPGPTGVAFPDEWRTAADHASGVAARLPAADPGTPRSAPQVLIDALTTSDQRVTVLALGPLSNIAFLVESAATPREQVAGIVAMAGIVDDPAVDGVGEWNAAVDPGAVATVLSSGLPVTIVTSDAVPAGTIRVPASAACTSATCELAAAVVGANAPILPSWWDAYAALFAIEPSLATATSDGAFGIDMEGPEAGRLRPLSDGPTVRVVTRLDAEAADALLASTLTSQ